jgi:hypothetical protein
MTVAELRNAQPRYAVRISPEARYTIEEELCRFQFSLRDNFETGGLLFGEVDGTSITVTMATGPGPDFKPEINQVTLDPYTVLGDEARAVADLVIGSWHAHPKPHLLRAADPSSEDLEHSASVLNRARSEAVVGLIALEGRTGGWSSPRLNAWVATRRDGETFCDCIGEIHL